MTAGLAAPPLRLGDPGYDEGRLAWNRNAQQTPAVVVMAESARDVQAAVRLARAEGRGVGVMATGHGVATAVDGGVLVNTSRMRGVAIDPAARTARVAAGARWSDVIPGAAAHGLACLARLQLGRGRRRLHDGRRLRLAGPPVRLRGGLRARGGGRDGRRRARAGGAGREPGPLLGARRAAAATSAS